MSKARELSELADVVTVDGASGKVGIGTDSPSAQVTIVSPDNLGGTPLLTALSNNLSQSVTMTFSGLTANAGAGIGFTVDGNRPGLFIHQSGNVYVGAEASNNTIGPRFGGGDTNDTAGTNHFHIWPEANGTSAVKCQSGVDSTAGRIHFRFSNNNGTVGQITTSGSGTAYETSSDYRLKEDVQPMANAIDRVKDLKPVNFAWKVDGTRVDGFIAHEVQAVVPEASSGTKDAMRDEEYEVTPAVLDEDGNVVTEAVMGIRSVPDYQGIDQSKLVPLLTAALQEALGKIDALEARVAVLETP